MDIKEAIQDSQTSLTERKEETLKKDSLPSSPQPQTNKNFSPASQTLSQIKSLPKPDPIEPVEFTDQQKFGLAYSKLHNYLHLNNRFSNNIFNDAEIRALDQSSQTIANTANERIQEVNKKWNDYCEVLQEQLQLLQLQIKSLEDENMALKNKLKQARSKTIDLLSSLD